MSFLLDTCVISEFVRPEPDSAVVAWLGEQHESSLYLSVITIGELEKGVAKLPASTRRKALETWIRRDLAERFRGRLIPVDAEVAALWGAPAGQSESRGVPLPVIDSLIAASSLVHGLTVVTRNVRDLERCGARCLNPWRKG